MHDDDDHGDDQLDSEARIRAKSKIINCRHADSDTDTHSLLNHIILRIGIHIDVESGIWVSKS